MLNEKEKEIIMNITPREIDKIFDSALLAAFQPKEQEDKKKHAENKK